MKTRVFFPLALLALTLGGISASADDGSTVARSEVYLPAVMSSSDSTELYLGFIELLDHCVRWDEILHCDEFEHAGGLSARDCQLAWTSAHLMCMVIGAPVSEGVTVP